VKIHAKGSLLQHVKKENQENQLENNQYNRGDHYTISLDSRHLFFFVFYLNIFLMLASWPAAAVNFYVRYYYYY